MAALHPVLDLMEPHSWGGSVTWRLTRKGVEVAGDIPRTGGEPVTATRIWETWKGPINRAAWEAGVPAELLIATAATESRGNPDWFLREEPGYENDEATPQLVSLGPCHVLLSTARWVLGDSTINRAWLMDPANNFRAAAALIARQSKETGLDPPMVAAAYNAGSLRADDSPDNRWKMHCYPVHTGRHIDRFVSWYNDAAWVLRFSPLHAAVTMLPLFA